MNFGQAFLLLFALAKVTDARVEHQTPKLRKLQSRNQNDWYVAGFEEELGDCVGAVCGKYTLIATSVYTWKKINNF
jgi:hypothetical protein